MRHKKLCEICEKRIACVAPCDRLAEELERITCKQKELTVGRANWGKHGDMQTLWNETKFLPLTMRERAVATLYMMRFSRKDITQLFNIKRSTLRKDLWRIKKKLKT